MKGKSDLSDIACVCVCVGAIVVGCKKGRGRVGGIFPGDLFCISQENDFSFMIFCVCLCVMVEVYQSKEDEI